MIALCGFSCLPKSPLAANSSAGLFCLWLSFWPKMASQICGANGMIRVMLVMALLAGFYVYAAKTYGFRELDGAFHGIEGRLTSVMEALQP